MEAVHDRNSAYIVAFLGNYPLICESEEKKQNNVSDDILQYLLAELLGLVKSGKFKQKESTIIWSKHVLYPKRAWTASTEIQTPRFFQNLTRRMRIDCCVCPFFVGYKIAYYSYICI